MSDNLINNITLDCLLNKEQYNKYILNIKQNINDNVNQNIKKENKDIKFYRKRIYYLTKELLLSKEQQNILLPEVKEAFNNYVKSCINYFKIIDRNDIIQEDYKDITNELDLLNETNALNENIIIDENIDPNNYLMRKINVKQNSLDTFVKKKKNTKEIILPKQKKINLKDPLLKNKGIIKKKNIINKYEETSDNKKISNATEVNENKKEEK
jgi:hypothetical protein